MTTPQRGRPSEGRHAKSYRLQPETYSALECLQGYGLDTETAAVEYGVLIARNALASASAEVEGMFARPEWNYLADVMNSPMIEQYLTWQNPASAIAAEAHDGHTLSGMGYQWFCDEYTGIPTPAQKRKVDSRVKDLVSRLFHLSTIQAWVVLFAIHRFWENSQSVNHLTDEWWRAKS